MRFISSGTSLPCQLWNVLAVAVLTAMLTSSSSCDKAPTFPAREYGEHSCKLNGLARGGKGIYAACAPGFDCVNRFNFQIVMRHESGNGNLVEEYIFTCKDSVGYYQVLGSLVGFTVGDTVTRASLLISDQAGHVIGEFYDPLLTDDIPDFIEIESISNGVYSGRFGGSFIRQEKKDRPVDHGDTIIISEGRFETRLLDE